MAANTLKRSTTPKYFAGTTFMPNAPTSIIKRAIEAHTAYERFSLSFEPAMIIAISEIRESSTTAAVMQICIFILECAGVTAFA